MARNIDCKCEYNFTCGYCLRNAKPWLYTPSDSSCAESPVTNMNTIDRAIMTGLIRVIERELGLVGVLYDVDRVVSNAWQRFTYQWNGSEFQLIAR